eukprot:CAMPEP_0202003498 /NCGR_PEP_ID=MMETSP0905-20130828/9060_1 /ASSEMBLY_ACC=CAM_ASM_000554 /TAXON_ID=420261 /ORGANISM="Thalassiosira antarctica, Strain CCMP982" /LENGTH=568 /DNA_ID=CAMNT_0048560641 /DNA_START=86 /DNA_END=1792 /DNA_ORIENTATION=+
MDLTPKSSTPWGSLFDCCRTAPAPSSSGDPDQKHGYNNEDVVIKPTTGNVVIRWLRDEKNILEKQEMAQRIDSLSTETKLADEKNIALGKELNDAKNAARQMQEQLNSKIDVVKAARNAQEQLNAKIESHVVKAASQAQVQLKFKIESLSADLLESKRDSATNLAVLAARSADVESLQKELEAVQKSLVDATMSTDLLLTEKDSMQKDMDEVTSKMNEISAAKDSMQLEIKSLHGKVEESTAAKAKEVENLQMELESTTAKSDELLAEKDSLQHKLETLESNVARITAAKGVELGNIKKELESVRLSRIDATNADVENLQQELASVQIHAEGNAEKLGNDLEAYRSRIHIADNSVETLSAQLNAAHAERDKLHEDITAWLDEMAKQKESQKQELTQQIETLTVGNDAAIGKVGEGGEEVEGECDSTIMQKDGGDSDVVPHMANIPSERPTITEEEDDATAMNVATTAKEQEIPNEEGPTVNSSAEATKPAESSSAEKVSSDEAAMTKDPITTSADTTTAVSPKKKKKKKKKKRPKLTPVTTPRKGDCDEEEGDFGFGDIAVSMSQSSN